MKIAIHDSKLTFSERWIDYCRLNGIEYKLVNCYNTDIIKQMNDCDALMWHHFQTNPKAILFAKQLLFALEQAGKKVFPDFNTGWHFDDKIGQKYLLEAINAPLVPSYVFYSKKEALDWVKETCFPKVFKLRRGAGSANVRLIKNPYQARKIINKAFGCGFKNYDAWSNFKEIRRKYSMGIATNTDIIKGIAHILYPPRYSKVLGREQGYLYFQDFIDGCTFDIRVKVIGDRCWAFKRLVRENDFRASGSNSHIYSSEGIPLDTIKIAFAISKKLKLQCVAFDFVLSNDCKSLLLEISYGFGYTQEQFHGYWDADLIWHEDRFDPFGWMVETVIKDING